MGKQVPVLFLICHIVQIIKVSTCFQLVMHGTIHYQALQAHTNFLVIYAQWHRISHRHEFGASQ